MAGYNIPQYNLKITPLTPPDYSSELVRLMSGMGGATGGVGGAGSGTRGTVRLTKEERQQLIAQQEQARAMQIVASDPQVQDKLRLLENAPVATQKATLQDIRRNDIRRIADATGVDSSTLFDAMLGPIQTQVNDRYRAVSEDAGSLSSLAGGARMGLNEMVGAFRAIGKSDAEARAIGREVFQQNEAIRTASPYWQDQALRDQTGELITGTGETGSYLANLARMAPQMAGMVGGTLGGAAVGTAAGGPVGTVVGGVSAAGALGAAMGSQDFISRVENDPRLTEEQKAEAISTGRLPAAIAGGVFNAIPINVNPLSQAALRAASGTVAGRAVNQLGQNVVGRLAGNTLLSGAELTAANVGDVLSRNVIYEQATNQDTPLTEGLGAALVQGAAMAPFFGAARGRTHGIPATERARPQADTQAAADAQPRTQVEVPVIEGYQEIRTPEMMNFDEAARAGYRTGIENKTIDNVQAIYDSYVRDGRSVDDFRNFLAADAASPTPLGDQITGRLRRLLPDADVQRTAEESAHLASVRQRVLGGEDITPEQARVEYTGTVGDETGLRSALSDEIVSAVKERNAPAAALYRTISKLGKSGEDPIGKFQQALDTYFTDGGNDTVLNRFLADAALKKAERSVLSPAPGKLTKAQQSLLKEAISRRQQESANVTRAAADSNMGRDVGVRTTAADTTSVAQNSGRGAGAGASPADVASGVVRTAGGSDGATQGGRLGGFAQPDQRTGQTPDVSIEAAGSGAGARADAGRGVESAALGDAAAGESAGGTRSEAVGDASTLGDAAAARVDVQSDGGDIVPTAQQLGIDAETVGRIIEETGQLPRTPQPDAQPMPFEATIPDAPRIIKLPDSETAKRLDATLVENMHTTPKNVADHLQKYFAGGGSKVQLDALLVRKGALSPRDKLLVMKAIETTPEVPVRTPNTAEVRAALAAMSDDAARSFLGKRAPKMLVDPERQIQRPALNLLVKESLGEKLTKAQQQQLAALHAAGIPELVLPEAVQQNVADAKMMNMDVSPEGLVEANLNMGETIEKITKQILCRAI